MNYKQAYKILNGRKGKFTIDAIIAVETGNGEALGNVKLAIINGINYFLQFVKESSFKNMGYWWHSPEKMEQRITQKICFELAKYEMVRMNKAVEGFAYMIKALPDVTKKVE
jgi:hypothetical protein